MVTHPKVADAGVVGVQVNGLELPRAYIVLRKPTDDAAAQRLVAKEVQEWIKPRVGKPKHLRGGVIVIQEIPKRSVICASVTFRGLGLMSSSVSSPAGKILRKVLRERAAKEILEVGQKLPAVSTRL